jgi:hypothetical protein
MPAVVQLIRTKFPLIPAVTWGFLILYLTLRPKSAGDIVSLPTWLAGLPIDKVAHFAFWGIWYGLYAYFYLKRPKVATSKSDFSNSLNAKPSSVFSLNNERILGIFTMIILGALIEIAQHQLNWGREAEWLDLVADATGVLIAALFLSNRISRYNWR